MRMILLKVATLLALSSIGVDAAEVSAPSCLESGSDLELSFKDSNPVDGDWFGLFPLDILDDVQVPEPRNRNWIWTCGSQDCDSVPSSGTFTIKNPKLIGSTKWIVVLGGAAKAPPYTVKAKSSSIEIKSSCSASDDDSDGQQEPTSEPTSDRSSSGGATPIVDFVNSDKKSYASGDTITVTFTIASPKSGDWVGIFDADTPLSSQDSAHFWLWAGCNRQGSRSACAKKMAGSVDFRDDKDIKWSSSWPLLPGRYRAALLRNDDSSSWNILDTSAPFEVREPPFGPVAVTLVRKQIKEVIRDDKKLAAKFLRLAFHDSVGGADGCVDLTDIHNRGLREPIEALAPIVKNHKGNLTRGDIWFLAGLEGARVSQRRGEDFKADFELTEFGRINCEKQNSVCRNEEGLSHGCSAMRGPFREIPGNNVNTHELYSFFKKQYDFDTEEVVALMGAHTIGELAKENSGIDGKNGWVLDNRILDNGYYDELIGGNSPELSLSTLINSAPNWKRFFERQEDGSDFDDIGIWHGLPEGPDGRVIVMLNVDIALVRDLNEDNLNSETGKVKCQFVERSGDDDVCPGLKTAIRQGARYKKNNRRWLIDFERVMRKMGNAHYDITDDCIDGLCKLAKRS